MNRMIADSPSRYTDSGMYRGWVPGDGVIEVRIYDR